VATCFNPCSRRHCSEAFGFLFGVLAPPTAMLSPFSLKSLLIPADAVRVSFVHWLAPPFQLCDSSLITLGGIVPIPDDSDDSYRRDIMAEVNLLCANAALKYCETLASSALRTRNTERTERLCSVATSVRLLPPTVSMLLAEIWQRQSW
jgi:hypothetical protein